MKSENGLYNDFKQLIDEVSNNVLKNSVMHKIDTSTKKFQNTLPELTKSLKQVNDLLEKLDTLKASVNQSTKDVTKHFDDRFNKNNKEIKKLEPLLKDIQSSLKKYEKQVMEGLENNQSQITKEIEDTQKKIDALDDYILNLLDERFKKQDMKINILIGIGIVNIFILLF